MHAHPYFPGGVSPGSVCFNGHGSSSHYRRAADLLCNDVVIWEAEPRDLHQPINAKRWSLMMEEVDTHKAHSQDVCFIQFLGAGDSAAQEVLHSIPDMPHIAGVATPLVRLGKGSVL